MELRKKRLTSFFIKERLEHVPARFVEFELENLDEDTLNALSQAFLRKKKTENLSNSALIYLLGLSDNYDSKRRCNYTVSGSGPDIDVDFTPEGRPRLIKALQDHYGKNKIAKVCTYMPWNLKTSVQYFTKMKIKDHDIVGEPIYGSHQDARILAEKIPDSYRGRHVTWEAIKDDPEFKQLIQDNQEVFNNAGALDGDVFNSGIHPCALLISTDPLSDYIPLRMIREEGEDWFFITQWDGSEVEQLGYIKYDTLSIKNLSTNEACLKMIGKPYEWLDSEVDLNDPKIYDLINGGFCAGLFQIEAEHVSDLIREVEPRSMEDIAVISALIRPGPKDSGLTDSYVQYRKTGINQNNIHPLLDSVLEETGGVIVYQEQVIKAFEILAGMSKADADEIRRAMGKKKPELMEFYREKFSQGCSDTNGIPKAEANRIWSTIEKFADYGFNKPHAHAYAVVAAQNGYLKAHYPLEFYVSLFASNSSDKEKLQQYIKEARQNGIRVKPPSINHSGLDFTVGPDRTILYGLSSLSGVGDAVAGAILEARGTRGFESFYDFMTRVNTSVVNTRSITLLAMAGCFDCFNLNRHLLMDKLPDIFDFFADLRKYQDSILRVEARNEEIAEWEVQFEIWDSLRKEGLVKKVSKEEGGWIPPRPKKPVLLKLARNPEPIDWESLKVDTDNVTFQMVQWEAEVCQSFMSAHPLDFIRVPDNREFTEIYNINNGIYAKGRILAAVSGIEKRKIKSGNNKGRKMYTITVQDYSGYANVTVFPSIIDEHEQLFEELKLGDVLYFNYRFDEDAGETKKVLMGKGLKKLNGN